MRSFFLKLQKMNYRYIRLQKLDKEGHIIEVQFSNRTKHNALSSELLRELINAFNHLKELNNVKVIVLSSATYSGVWSSGHDLNELKVKGFDPLSKKSAYKRFVMLLKNFQKPVIVIVDGSVWGGAVEIVFLSDIIITTPQAKFYLTALKIGFPYDIDGLMNLISATGNRIFREMFFTANGLTAKRAERLGIINYVVQKKSIMKHTLKIATAVAENSNSAMSLVKLQLAKLNQQLPVTSDLKNINSLRKKILRNRSYKTNLLQ